MATAREIKRRIGSVKNIAQVTRALEAVSASKVRKAQKQVLDTRPYSEKAWEIVVNVASVTGESEHPLLKNRGEPNAIDIVLITSDRSLCGAYNNNIIRIAENFAAMQGLPNEKIRWITIGRKGRDYLLRRQMNVIAEFSKMPDSPSITDVNPIGQILVDDFLQGISDHVFIAYTDFVNTLTQRPRIMNLLPLQPYNNKQKVQVAHLKTEPKVTIEGRDYIYEPDADTILDEVIPRTVTLEIYQALMESLASEHSARMIAMRNASENAVALASDLTLEYNKARQLAITSEILDIVGGVAAMENNEKQSQRNSIVDAADDFITRVGGDLKAEQRN